MALTRASQCWAQAGEHASATGVVYCIEPLSADQSDVINTVAQAVEIVEQIGSPDTVYETPATPFVYQFLGNVNLFHSRVHDGIASVAGLRNGAGAYYFKYVVGNESALGNFNKVGFLCFIAGALATKLFTARWSRR